MLTHKNFSMKKLFLTCLVAIFATFVFGQNKIPVQVPELPKCIPDYVKKNLSGYNIEKGYKWEFKSDKTVNYVYKVKCIKGKDIQWLQCNGDCRDMKKITPAEAEKDPPKPLPPIKQGNPTDKEKEKADQPKK